MPHDAESGSLEEQVHRLEARIRVLEAKLAASERTVETREAHGRVPPPRRPDDLEARVGAYWLSRVGIVVFITGVAFLVIYKFGELGIALRIAAGYGVGAGLAGVGHWIARRHRVFGEVLFGGGLAVAYFVTYALHFVPAVRVIESRHAAFALLCLAIVAVVLVAHRMRSETVAGIALFLGLHTGMLSDVTAYTLAATCLLAAGAVLFLVTHRWVVVPASGLAAAYATHARWVLAGSEGGSHALSLGFLAVYFSLFAAAILVRPGALDARGRVVLPLANAAGLLGLGWWELRAVDGALFTFVSVVAFAHVALTAAAHARDRERRELVDVNLAIALVSASVAGWLKLGGASFGGALALTAVSAAAAARIRRAPSLAWVGFAILLAALLRQPLLTPEPILLALVASAALVGGELVRPAAARGWEAGILGGHAGLAALGLLRLASAVAPDGFETLAWAVAASLLFAAGFLARARRYRLAGFVAFALTGARLAAVDLRRLGPDLRIATFLLLGGLLLGVSFVYARRRGGARERS
jgi:hypothetical protein